MGVFLIVLVVLLILSASVAGMLVLRDKTRGLRFLLLAPIPVAIAVGIFAAAYFVTYASDYLAVLFFVGLLMLAAWLVGFVFCAIVTATKKAMRSKPTKKDYI